MPKHKTSFRVDWLTKTDANGHLIGDWCKGSSSSKFEVSCKFCKKNVRCDNRGLSQLLMHAETKLHADTAKDFICGSQLLIQHPVVDQKGSLPSWKPLTCWSHKDNITKAELLWAMKIASSNSSYSSSNDSKDLFVAMFPDSTIAAKFSMGSTKLSYTISEAVGPYFHECLLNDITNSGSPFTLVFDELSNKQVKKQLDIKIRYWSHKFNQVKVNHLNTYMMGRATGKDIAGKIFKSIDDNKLELKNFLMMGSDGPNVNQTVTGLVNERKKSMSLPVLVDMGTCSLHIVHGCIGKGVNAYGKEAVDLVIDLHAFFKLSPVRMEEFAELQQELISEELKFLKHVTCRWLTLKPALQRILKLLPVLERYIVVELPKRDKKVTDNPRYCRILACVKTRKYTVLAQMHFLLGICELMEPFLFSFQKEEPMIHTLYDDMEKLIKTVLGRFLKPESMQGKTLDDLLSLQLTNKDKQLSDEAIEIGRETRKAIMHLKSFLQKVSINDMRVFFEKVSSHLIKKLPLKSVLKSCKCLQPKVLIESWTVSSIKKLAEDIVLDPVLSSEVISDEWRVLQCENIPAEWYQELDEDGEPRFKRIDFYWREIFSIKDSHGLSKYPELTRLIKAILVLSHGNADPERGFSQVANFLTDSRTPLSEASISSLQSTKDGLRQYDNQIHSVPITKEFLTKGRNAHKSYLLRLEDRRTEEEGERASEAARKERIRRRGNKKTNTRRKDFTS